MTFLRRQLPVYSPIGFRSLVTGLGGAIGLGRPRERLRERLAEHFGTTDVLLTDSGTTALRLAISGAVEVADPADASGAAVPDAAVRDAVALPAYCCYDVVTAAVGAGARIRLYDVDPATLGPDWPSLEDALATGDVATVVAVHLYGIPVDIERMRGLADAHGALVIDDAAQGFGGSLEGRPLGALGSLGVLSFGRGKGITGGGGGALLANDAPGRAALAAVRDRLSRGRRGWAELAKLAAQWLLGRPSVYGLPASLPWLGLGETRYEEPWPPRGIASGPAAAVLANWEASLAEAEARRGNAEMLVGVPGRLGAPNLGGARSCPLRLPVVIDARQSEEGGVQLERSGVVPGYPRSLASVLEEIGTEGGGRPVPGAERLAARLLTAPVHSLSRPEDVRRVLTECRRA